MLKWQFHIDEVEIKLEWTKQSQLMSSWRGNPSNYYNIMELWQLFRITYLHSSNRLLRTDLKRKEKWAVREQRRSIELGNLLFILNLHLENLINNLRCKFTRGRGKS